MTSFIYDALPTRVVFGLGSLARLASAIEALGAKRALLLSTPEQTLLAEEIAAGLGNVVVGLFARAVMHVPMETVKEARAEARRLDADCAVAIGGGSTTGLGKAIALESGLPIIAIPTTYAGSEMTPIYGLTVDGVKTTGRDRRVLPKTVVYDPVLTTTLPFDMSVTSGINAIAHAAEGLYAADGNPIISLMAAEGVRALAAALPRLATESRHIGARSDALYGAWLCGTVLGAVSMGLHHKLCHTLGGSFDLPHAAVHTVILPHALAYNAAHAPEAMTILQRALAHDGADTATSAAALVHDLAVRHHAPSSLREIGMPSEGLDRAADLASASPFPNPRPLDRTALRRLLQDAWDGRRPD